MTYNKIHRFSHINKIILDFIIVNIGTVIDNIKITKKKFDVCIRFSEDYNRELYNAIIKGKFIKNYIFFDDKIFTKYWYDFDKKTEEYVFTCQISDIELIRRRLVDYIMSNCDGDKYLSWAKKNH
jgi:hypothetical protein